MNKGGPSSVEVAGITARGRRALGSLTWQQRVPDRFRPSRAKQRGRDTVLVSEGSSSSSSLALIGSPQRSAEWKAFPYVQ